MPSSSSSSSSNEKVNIPNQDVGTGATRLVQKTPMYDWAKKGYCGLCKSANFVLQLVLTASMGSFLFGFNLALMNTALNVIAWELWPCLNLELSDACNQFTVPALNRCLADNECKYGDLTCELPTPAACSRAMWYGAFMSTAVFVGAAIGSMSGGRFLTVGRRALMLVTMALFILGIVSSVVSNSFSSLMWSRLVCGYAVGLIAVLAPTLMSEVTPAAKRGSYGVFHQLFITIGIFVGVLIGLPLGIPVYSSLEMDVDGNIIGKVDVPQFEKIWWRVMLGSGILPVFLCILLYGMVYSFETPQWYAENERMQDCDQLLKRIHKKEDVTKELDEIRTGLRESEIAKQNGLSLARALGKSEYRLVIIVGALLSAFQQLSGINIFIASSNLMFSKAGMEGSTVTILSICMTALNVLMTFPTIYLIEKLGRKTLLLIGVVGMCLSMAPAMIMFLAVPDSSATPWVAIVGIFGFIVFFACTYGPILWVYLFEVFPSEIKDSGAAAATVVNWVAGIVMVFIGNVVTEPKTAYSIFVALNAIGIIVVGTLMRETKGRPLGDSPYIKRRENAVAV